MKTILKLKMRIILYILFFLVSGLVALQGVAGAAINMPELDSLAPLTDRIVRPADVAVDQQGRAYVAAASLNIVTILDQRGTYVGQVDTIKQPLSVAVGPDGRVLIGTAADGSVSVFDSGLGFLFKLGQGNDEFVSPVDIKVDSSGNIYVVDKDNNSIRTYDFSGAYTGSIGTPGNGDGQLHRPLSVAIDENAGEIVVLDLQQIEDPSLHRLVDGARIQYFDMNGVLLRAYSKFGYNNADGEMIGPKEIAVDAMNRIYVTDARSQKVMVYDNYDNFLGAINMYNVGSPLPNPKGLTIGASGKLYVASSAVGKVEVFELVDPSAMLVTPAAVTFNVVENGSAPFSQEVTIANQGEAVIELAISTPDSWISFVPSTTTLLATETGYINITVDQTGIAPGEYRGSVVIDTSAGALETITVILNVEPNPLQVGPCSLSFETSLGTTPASQQLFVDSSDGVSLWTAFVDQPTMISLNKTIGPVEDTVKVYVDTTSLDVGTHGGFITFSQDGSVDVQVPVDIIITESENPSDELPGLGGNGNEKWNKKWTITTLLDPGINLNGVTGTSKSDVYAVGDAGVVLHFDGKDWTQDFTGINTTLNSVWSSSKKSVYAVGAEGVVLNYNGDWTTDASGGDALQDIWGGSEDNIVIVDEFGSSPDLGFAPRTVWGTAVDNVFVAGEAGSISSFDGTAWTPMTSNTSEWINGLWASSATDVFAVGENGTIVHFDGTEWTAMNSGVTSNINGVCGISATDIYAVGDDSVLLYFDGTEWAAMDTEAGVNLNDIWCLDKNDVIAVGDDGTIIFGKGSKFQGSDLKK